MRFVPDNSVAMQWLLINRQSDVKYHARAVLQRLVGGDVAVAPDLFAFEAANALVKSQKREMVSKSIARDFPGLLADLDIETDPTTH